MSDIDPSEATLSQVREVIVCVHKLYYDPDLMRDRAKFYQFHQHMGWLFNCARIEDTLCDNNPGECTPAEFRSGFAGAFIGERS